MGSGGGVVGGSGDVDVVATGVVASGVVTTGVVVVGSVSLVVASVTGVVDGATEVEVTSSHETTAITVWQNEMMSH